MADLGRGCLDVCHLESTPWSPTRPPGFVLRKILNSFIGFWEKVLHGQSPYAAGRYCAAGDSNEASMICSTARSSTREASVAKRLMIKVLGCF